MASKYEGHPQYVPIIKWQMWEQRALKELFAPVAGRTLPCIEARLPAQHASMLANFANVWKQAALIDYSDPQGKLTPTRLNELIQFLKLVGGSGSLSIPVLNPATAAADFPLISPHLGDRNVALRLRLSNIEHVPYGIAIVQAALAVPGLAAKANRLIVDLGPTPAYGAAEKNALAGMLLALKALGFAHIHLASGAFPMSLAHINGAGEVKRKDWDLWASVEALAPAALVGFSDYGPLSPNWSEETLTRRGSRVTIRYALHDKWRIVRGQYATKAESNAISGIFLTNYPTEFQGKPFSFGDRLIADRVDPTVAAKDKTGGHYHITEFWTHHISYVLQKQY